MWGGIEQGAEKLFLSNNNKQYMEMKWGEKGDFKWKHTI